MSGRIIDIAGQPRHLSLHRGFLVIRDNQSELGRVDLDSIFSVIVSSLGATFSSALLCRCAELHIPVIICNRAYQPQSIAISIHAHSDQARRYQLQGQMKTGLKNQLWKQIVTVKIRMQACLLDLKGASGGARLRRLAQGVKAGDSENVEAQAAQTYWKAIFGGDFRRGQMEMPPNALLNYGYAILRSSMIKALLSSGLCPTFGIHHRNLKNPFCLADDLMEPYRPLVDQMVSRLSDKGESQLTAPVKASLASLTAYDLVLFAPSSNLLQHMSGLSWYILQRLEGQKADMPLFSLPTTLEMERLVQ